MHINQLGDTALHIATQQSKRAIVELLILGGASLNTQNKVCFKLKNVYFSFFAYSKVQCT